MEVDESGVVQQVKHFKHEQRVKQEMHGMHDLEKEAYILHVKHDHSYQGLLGVFIVDWYCQGS